MSKTIGILGGMGPRATIDLYEKIISNTPARVDQDHLHILINNNPKIPSRVEGGMHDYANPFLALIESALVLEKAGADFIIMPCHTAHIWIEELQKNISIPFYNMIENTVEYILENQLNSGRILILATQTTIEKKLYQNIFDRYDLPFLVPSKFEQQVIYNLILKVKAGYIKNNPYINALNEILTYYRNEGVTSFLAACTEIPLLSSFLSKDIELLDPTLMLAKMAIEKALDER